MKWVGVRQLLDVYSVVLDLGRVVKEGGNVEVTMHLSTNTVIVKECASALQ